MLGRVCTPLLILLFCQRQLVRCGEPDASALSHKGDKSPTSWVIRMPAYQPKKNDDYVCHAEKVPGEGYITAFWPTAHADRVHHMLLFGCEQPLQPNDTGVWPCGSGCGMGTSKMLYAWARNAPEFVLPDGVSFAIGNADVKIYYLVLQVHYAQPFDGAVWDYGGVKMDISLEPTPNLAAIYLFFGQSDIPPKLDALFMNMTCAYNGDAPIHPFAFRTHAHALGRMISAAYRHDDQWAMIGRRNPQWPQLFEKVNRTLTIVKGDQMAALCRYDSTSRNKTTRIGMSGSDEMCNFYMMYWRDAASPDPFSGSRTNGCPELAGSTTGKQKIFATYPEEGTALLPKNEELETIAHQSGIKFGKPASKIRQRRQISDYPGGGVYFNRRRPPIFRPDAFPQDGSDDLLSRRRQQQLNPPQYSDDYANGDGGYPFPTGRAGKPAGAKSTKAKSDSRVMPVAQQPAAVCDNCVVERAKWSSIGSTVLGQVSGLAVDPLSGHLLIFHRATRSWDAGSFDASNRLTDRSPIAGNTVLEVDAGSEPKSTPKLLKSWGANLFYMPHAIYADGRGAVWTTDVGSHQVIKWTVDKNKNYQSSITLGTKFEPGDDHTHFCKPAGVVAAADGSVFVADGYCNARVVKFDAQGNFVEQFGSTSPAGKSPAPLGTFSLPHDLSLDSGARQLYVADRQNGRVQVFSLDDHYKPLGEIRPSEDFDTVYAVDFSSPGKAVFFVPGEPSTRNSDSPFKAFAANPTTRQLMYAWTTQLGSLSRPHTIKASPDGRFVYIGEITQPAGLVRKFEVMREKSQRTVGDTHGNKGHAVVDKESKKANAAPEWKPSSSGDASAALVVGTEHNWLLITLVVLVAPLAIACLACYCMRRRSRGSWRDDLRINRPLLNRTDRKGFRPLATDDAEGMAFSTDESENEDTLYKAGLPKP